MRTCHAPVQEWRILEVTVALPPFHWQSLSDPRSHYVLFIGEIGVDSIYKCR